MSLSNILEINNPVAPQPWTLLHAKRYKGLELDVGELINVDTVNGTPLSQYRLEIENAPGSGDELLTEIASRDYQIKRLTSGSGITLTPSADDITISTNVSAQKYTWPGPTHSINVGDPFYSVPWQNLVFSVGQIFTQVTTPGIVEILQNGLYLVNWNIPVTYTGVLTTTRNYTSRLNVNGVNTSRSTSALWAGYPCELMGTTILPLNAGDSVTCGINALTVGQDGPLVVGAGFTTEFSFTKLL